MEILLNASLAGGVIIGAACDMIFSPGGAIVIGAIGGLISALGFAFLTKPLQNNVGLHDTCGVHNLHGIPGVLGGVIGAVVSSFAGRYLENKDEIALVFPEIAKGTRTFE
jgi:ammonium transporter Rh